MIIGAVVALAFAAPALAKDKDPVFVEAAAVKDKPAVALDKTKGYILLRSDTSTSLYLMKMPTPQDQATYDKLRAAGLTKAHAKFVKKQKEYDSVAKQRAETPPGVPKPLLPDKPVEPTEANFEFTPFGLLADVPIGPVNRFAKADGGVSTYVEEVTAGDYRIYGPMVVNPGVAASGACFCMGSVGFTVKAGEITDIGVLLIKANVPAKRPAGDSSAPTLQANTEPFFSTPPPGMAIDPRLSALPVVPATFFAVGKLPNYYGLTITRMQEMPGILRYDRDRIVDLRPK